MAVASASDLEDARDWLDGGVWCQVPTGELPTDWDTDPDAMFVVEIPEVRTYRHRGFEMAEWANYFQFVLDYSDRGVYMTDAERNTRDRADLGSAAVFSLVSHPDGPQGLAREEDPELEEEDLPDYYTAVYWSTPLTDVARSLGPPDIYYDEEEMAVLVAPEHIDFEFLVHILAACLPGSTDAGELSVDDMYHCGTDPSRGFRLL